MRISKECAACLYDKQKHLSDNEDYLEEIRYLLDTRAESDTSPLMVYKFTEVYERYFGKKPSYVENKKKYNDLVLAMEQTLRERIEASNDPFVTSFLYARIGNYIDFGAMNTVDDATFLALFDDAKLSELDEKALESFIAQCESGKRFLLITDNCGEVVLDKLFLEQMGKRFPHLEIAALVRGGEVLNDATMEDALYVGLDQVASVYGNGIRVAGTVYSMLSEDVKALIDDADVIMAKGQGNYESMSGQGMHVFYAFLCKCDLFTGKFGVPRLTGMFVEE